MSTSSPARLSRRSLLRGAASVCILAGFAPASSCADGADPSGGETATPAPTTATTTNRAAAAGATPVLWLGHELAASPSGSTLAAEPPAGLAPLRSDLDVIRATASFDPAVRADFASGRVVLADGWSLAHTEGAVLVAYAGACPMPSC
jgi:hypothetical protein